MNFSLSRSFEGKVSSSMEYYDIAVLGLIWPCMIFSGLVWSCVVYVAMWVRFCIVICFFVALYHLFSFGISNSYDENQKY